MPNLVIRFLTFSILSVCSEALDQIKKEIASANSENAKTMATLKDKNNKLQTELGNSENESAAAKKKAKEGAEQLVEANKELKLV